MFDIGFIELMVVSMVALIVVGPERLPKVARTLGHLIGRARRYANGVKIDIHNELRMDELKEMQASMQETASSIKGSVRQEIDQLKTMVEVKESKGASLASTTDKNLDSQVDSTTIPAAKQPANTTKQDQP